MTAGTILGQAGWDFSDSTNQPNIATLIPSPALRVVLPSTTDSGETAFNDTGIPWFDPTLPYSLQLNFRYEQPVIGVDPAITFGMKDPVTGAEISVIVQIDAFVANNKGDVTFIATDTVNAAIIWTDVITLDQSLWHRVYVTFDGSTWTLTVDSTEYGNDSTSLDFSGSTMQAFVVCNTSVILYRVQGRYGNIAQPDIAIQPAAFSGPIT